MKAENFTQIDDINIMYTDLFLETEKMRSLQIRYFKTRDPRALSLSKKLEKKVDQRLDETPEAYIQQKFYGEFYSAVELMRSLQKNYFATKSPSVLEVAKRAEIKVDQWLTKIRNPKLF